MRQAKKFKVVRFEYRPTPADWDHHATNPQVVDAVLECGHTKRRIDLVDVNGNHYRPTRMACHEHGSVEVMRKC